MSYCIHWTWATNNFLLSDLSWYIDDMNIHGIWLNVRAQRPCQWAWPRRFHLEAWRLGLSRPTVAVAAAPHNIGAFCFAFWTTFQMMFSENRHVPSFFVTDFNELAFHLTILARNFSSVSSCCWRSCATCDMWLSATKIGRQHSAKECLVGEHPKNYELETRGKSPFWSIIVSKLIVNSFWIHESSNSVAHIVGNLEGQQEVSRGLCCAVFFCKQQKVQLSCGHCNH